MRQWKLQVGDRMMRLSLGRADSPSETIALIREASSAPSTWLQLCDACRFLRRRKEERDLGRDMVLRTLTDAVLAGELRLEEAPRPRNLPSAPGGRAEPTRPKPAAPKKGWFDVGLLDEVGEPIVGVPLRLEVAGAPVPTDGQGRVHIEPRTEGTSGVASDDRAALVEAMKGRWNEVREVPWVPLDAPAHTHFALRTGEEISAVIVRDTAHNMVIQPWVVRARFEGFLYDLNKSFLLPSAVAGPKGLRAPIAELRQWFVDHPSTHALVVGHTDVTGEPWYNDPLSVERAETFRAYLRRDVEHWLGWYGADRSEEKRWGAHEDLLMLGALVDVDDGPEPVKRYQRSKGLVDDGFIGPITRRELVIDYMDLQGHQPLPAEVDTHGCGESFPRADKPNVAGVDAVAPEDAKEAADRRVEVFLFDAALGVQPAPPGDISPAGSKVYPEWVRRARHTRVWRATRAHTMAVRVCDLALDPIPDATVWLDDIQLRADHRGIVNVPFRDGEVTKSIAWAAPHEDAHRHDGTLFVAFDDDDDGVRRKLHNLGYPSARPVEAFQEEFGRPVTGSLDDIRADVHDWHDHGPKPSSAIVLTGGGGGPGVSPMQGGPARATVVPDGLTELQVGVLIGGEAPRATDTIDVVLLAKGAATVGARKLSMETAEVDPATSIAKFFHLSRGSFELNVQVERSHAGGQFDGEERQTIKVHHRGVVEKTNVRIPLATITAATQPFPSLLEVGSPIEARGVATSDPTDPPSSLGWTGGSGVGLKGDTSKSSIEVTATTANKSAGLRWERSCKPAQLRRTSSCDMRLISRSGAHQLSFVAAEVIAIHASMEFTKPVAQRAWLPKQTPKGTARFTHRSLNEVDRHDDEPLSVLRCAGKQIQLRAETNPPGVSDIVWGVKRYPFDHASLGSGLPTTRSQGNTCSLELDETGAFYVTAALDCPLQAPNGIRAFMCCLLECSVESASVTLKADGYSLEPVGDPVPYGVDLSSGGTDRHNPEGWAIQMDASVRVIGGGPKGRLGTSARSPNPKVKIGWINNILSHNIVAHYTGGGSVRAVFSKHTREHQPRHILPGQSWPGPIVAPIADSSRIIEGGTRPMLSQTTQSFVEHDAGIGALFSVKSLDSPGMSFWIKFEDWAKTKVGAPQTLTELSYKVDFRAFLCAFASNAQAVGAPARWYVGQRNYVALGEVSWRTHGEGGLIGQGKYALDQGASNTVASLPIEYPQPRDAHDAGCETGAPGSLDAARYLLTI